MNKICTSIEQSKELMKFLPLESADMFYRNNGIDVKLMWEHNAQKVTSPCWSQTALYNILPVTFGNILEKNALRLRIDKGENDFAVWYENIDTRLVEDGLDVIASNPVDAYFEMIIKLHEQKLI